MSVGVGASVAFGVAGAGGNAISWSALSAADGTTGVATIDPSGLFRADGAGRYLVVAMSGAEHAFAYVTVSDGAASRTAATVMLKFTASRTSSSDKHAGPTVSDFWIESAPDSVRVAPGGSTKLSAIGRSADGAKWIIRPEWKATGGTVSDSGLYVAPAVDGPYRVIVTRQGDIQTDTSVVVVTKGAADSASAPAPTPTPAPAPAPTPTPTTPSTSTPDAPVPSMPAVTTACTNEPAGYRRVIDASWNELPALNPVVNSEGFTYFAGQNTTLSLVQDPTALASAPSVLQVLYPKGFVGGFAPSKWATGNLQPNTGNLFVCFWFKVSPNWTTMGHNITKFFYVKQEGSGLAHAVISSGYDDHLYLQTLLQYPDNRLNYNLGESITPENDISGGWHKIEVLWEANTPGQRNGGFHQWVDGRLTGSDQSAYWFLDGLSPYWDSLWFEPTFGSPDNVVPADQSWYLDQMVVSVK